MRQIKQKAMIVNFFFLLEVEQTPLSSLPTLIHELTSLILCPGVNQWSDGPKNASASLWFFWTVGHNLQNLAVVDHTLDFRLDFRFHFTVKLISIEWSCKIRAISSITFFFSINVVLLGLMWATNLREQCSTESFLMAYVTQ